MANLQLLEQKVKDLYLTSNPKKDDWADWLYTNHVLVVADTATDLARRFSGSNETARAAALLHDIADATTKRGDPDHKKICLEIAIRLLKKSSYTDKESKDILEDALPFHSCHGNERPITLDGKILSTADALAHLQADFYAEANKFLVKKGMQQGDFNKWAQEKIVRDFGVKIAWDEVREENRDRYDSLMNQYS